MKIAATLSVLLLLAGCANTLETRGAEGPVRLGQVALAGGVRVRPDRLVEDSRCPVGTQCVWAGRVVVRATMLGGSGSRQIDLTLGTPVRVADGQLTLVSVEPEPREGEQVPPQLYRFTFAFEGGL